MRGLTPEERQMLHFKAAGGNLPIGSGVNPELRQLRSVGRVSIASVKVVGDEEVTFHAITDLGRLALRVCPAGEP
jgi:hypothetical protein